MLQQFINNQWCPVAFFSKKLKPAKTQHNIFYRELLAIYLAIKKFCHVVEGHQFIILALYLFVFKNKELDTSLTEKHGVDYCKPRNTKLANLD